jgi:hypothetical protein
MTCEGPGCGLDISMAGAQLCPICDPDIDAILERTTKKKTPDLCADCYKKHVEAHGVSSSSTTCPNCGNPDYDGVSSCPQCGVGPQIGSS